MNTEQSLNIDKIASLIGFIPEQLFYEKTKNGIEVIVAPEWSFHNDDDSRQTGIPGVIPGLTSRLLECLNTPWIIDNLNVICKGSNIGVKFLKQLVKSSEHELAVKKGFAYVRWNENHTETARHNKFDLDNVAQFLKPLVKAKYPQFVQYKYLLDKTKVNEQLYSKSIEQQVEILENCWSLLAVKYQLEPEGI